MLFGSLHMRLVMLLQVVVIRSDNQQFQQYFMHSRSIHTINLSECVAKRLITRVDEACLSLSLSLLVYANVCLAFSSFSFFSSFFFYFANNFCSPCMDAAACFRREKERQRKGSIDGNEENSCVNKIDR